MHDSLWEYYDKQATEALNERRYTKASRLVKDALYRATIMGDLKPELVQRAEDLARVHRQSGDYTSAAAIYRMILELQRSTLGPEHPAVENSSRDLIEALMNSGCITPGHA
jgi:hypothetical protein